MSELNEACWSVLSERGCEASQLSYPAAAQLVAQLQHERVHGLCIITAAAAARLNHAQPTNNKPTKKRTTQRKATKSRTEQTPSQT